MLKSLKDKSLETFGLAVEFIIKKLGLVDLSLSIFNKDSVQFIGYRRVSSDAEIQLMALSYKRGKFTLYINEKTCAYISVEEFAFLLIHETLHYILKHPFMCVLFKNADARNISMDLIVNDIIKLLVSMVPNLTWEQFTSKFNNKYYFGLETINSDCTELSVSKVYTRVCMLMAKRDDEDKPLKIPGASDQENARAIQHASSTHQEHSDVLDSNSELQLARDIVLLGNVLDSVFNETNSEEGGEKQLIAGSGAGHTRPNTFDAVAMRFKFNKVFKALLGESLLRGDYAKRNVKGWVRQQKSRLSLPDSQGLMPSFRRVSDMKKVLHIYLDISGSISAPQLQMFVALMQNIPVSKYEIHAYTFDVYIQEITLQTILTDGLMSGGGTDFNAIAKHVNAQPIMPDNIVIVTDGESKLDYTLVKQEHRQRWRWIIEARSQHFFRRCVALLPGMVFDLKKMQKDMR